MPKTARSSEEEGEGDYKKTQVFMRVVYSKNRGNDVWKFLGESRLKIYIHWMFCKTEKYQIENKYFVASINYNIYKILKYKYLNSHNTIQYYIVDLTNLK